MFLLSTPCEKKKSGSGNAVPASSKAESARQSFGIRTDIVCNFFVAGFITMKIKSDVPG